MNDTTTPDLAHWTAALAETHGIAARRERLAGEYDLNFRVLTDGTATHVLKVMRPGCDPGLVEMQCAALAHLAHTAPAVPLPRVVPALDGASVVTRDGPDGQPRLLWLVTLLDGAAYGNFRPHRPALPTGPMKPPRVRDFRGISPRSFDGNGNFSLGLKEQIVFPEIDYDRVDQIRGMDVVICTTAKTDDEARVLLKGLDMPFSGRDLEKEKEEEAARRAALEVEKQAARDAMKEVEEAEEADRAAAREEAGDAGDAGDAGGDSGAEAAEKADSRSADKGSGDSSKSPKAEKSKGEDPNG